MSLYAQRDGDHVIISATSGAVEVCVREHVDHVRHFWGELGTIVNQAEQAEAGLDGGDIEGGV